MIITYHGLEFVKLSVGDMVVAFNPPSKESKYKSSSFGADIVLQSLNHPDFNGGETLSRGDKEPFVITGPGEYETKNVFIKGFASESKYDGKDHINTIYSLTVDNLNVCFLGALGTTNIKTEIKEAFDEIDILFVPVGDEGVLGPSEAYKLAVSLEPKLIIPIHYDEKSLKAFIKEGGSDKSEAVDKLTLKRKDLDGREGDIQVLSVS